MKLEADWPPSFGYFFFFCIAPYRERCLIVKLLYHEWASTHLDFAHVLSAGSAYIFTVVRAAERDMRDLNLHLRQIAHIFSPSENRGKQRQVLSRHLARLFFSFFLFSLFFSYSYLE